MPRNYDEMPNDVLLTMAVMGDQEVRWYFVILHNISQILLYLASNIVGSGGAANTRNNGGGQRFMVAKLHISFQFEIF